MESFQHEFNNWMLEMKQAYKEYKPNEQVDFLGTSLPHEEFEINLDQEVRTAVYDPTASSTSNLQVLMILSDIEDNTKESTSDHLYLFVLDNATPRVLICEEAADSNGHLHFRDTQNEQLKEIFVGNIN